MGAPPEATARWEITGVRHGGITVSDLDRSLVFYRDLLGLELLWRRLYEEPAILEIVGVPEATGLEIAMLRVPGGEVDVELIEYQGLARRSGSSPPSDHGTGHFCVFVRGIEALHAELAAKGVRFRSDGPVEMTGGPNKGGKSLYSIDPDGYIFEFHERPPDVAS
jgi:catechol 2,3-dioxygenase-like lactoylglutathione lyase family enzyme